MRGGNPGSPRGPALLGSPHRDGARLVDRLTRPGQAGPSGHVLMSSYVELHCHSNYSFLDGASFPWELAQRAAELEMPALAITASGGVYGAVKFVQACRKFGVKPVI